MEGHDAIRVVLAPALTELGGLGEDAEHLRVAEAILAACESADGHGLFRRQIAERAGFAVDDPQFALRFDHLVRAGALVTMRDRKKKHEVRYRPEPEALLATEVFARLASEGGAQELHSLLVAAADTLAAVFDPARNDEPPGVEMVAGTTRKLTSYLHAYAQRMEVAVASGTLQEMERARIGSAANRQFDQVERIARYINRADSPYRALFSEAARLLAAGQRLTSASQQLARQLTEVARAGEGGGILGLLDAEQCLAAAVQHNPAQLAQLAADIPFDICPPVVTLADLQVAAAAIDRPRPPRRIPHAPEARDGERDPAQQLEQRRDHAQRRQRARRRWAEVTLGGETEDDLTVQTAGWPAAARLLADLMALSREVDGPFIGDIGDPPLIEADAEVVVRHPLRLRRRDAAAVGNNSTLQADHRSGKERAR